MSVWPSTRRAAKAHCFPNRRAAAFTSHTDAIAIATVSAASPHSTTRDPDATGENCLCCKGKKPTLK